MKIWVGIPFLRKTLFFYKKKVHQKKLRAHPILIREKLGKFYYQSNFFNFFWNRMVRFRNLRQLADLKLALGLDYGMFSVVLLSWVWC